MFKDTRGAGSRAGKWAALLVVAFALALAPAAWALASPSGSKSSDNKPAVNVDAQIAELTQIINTMDGLTQAEKEKLAKKVAKEFPEMAREAVQAGMTPDDLLALVRQAINSGSSLNKAMDQAEKQVEKAREQLEKEEQKEQEEQQKEQQEDQAQNHDDGDDNDHDSGSKDSDGGEKGHDGGKD